MIAQVFGIRGNPGNVIEVNSSVLIEEKTIKDCYIFVNYIGSLVWNTNLEYMCQL